MAIRRVYLFAYTTRGISARSIVCGFTVARSVEQVRGIIRMHVPPSRRFRILSILAGEAHPDIVGAVAAELERYSFEWHDPRPKHERDDAEVSELVPRLITAGLAL